MNLKNFQILTLRNGYQIIQSLVTPIKYSRLGLIISTFCTVSELVWYKSEIIRARDKGVREYAGQNTFECYVTGDMCEMGHESDIEKLSVIPTEIVLTYIEEAILFIREFESGKISSIIPESKKDNWVIVPKYFVKEEYWKTHSIDEIE